MRHLSLCLCSCLVAFAQVPVLQVDRVRVDLGPLTRGAVVDVPFEIRNAGSAPLRISHLTTSCGCTTVRTEPFEIAPKATHPLTVQLDTRELKGRFRRTVTVSSNDGQTPNLELVLEGEVQEGRKEGR